MRICVVGDADDLSAAYVGWLAGQRGVEVLLLREDRIGLDWSFRLDRDDGALDLAEASYSLAEIDGAFVRLNPTPPVSPELGVATEAEHIYAIERRHALHWLLDEVPFTVVNRPSAGRSNGSKPLQMQLLANAGFDVPRWVATNRAEAAEVFLGSCPEGAVYKSCSGLRSHVRRADESWVERLRVGTAPVVLQEYVPGSDVRVHVVGDETFATEVRSEGVDYRFVDRNEYASTDAPDQVARLCVEVARAEGLLLAGFDFRRDEAGSWRCLEVNPVPTFLPYEAATGHQIGDAILDLLAPGSGERRPSRLAEVAEL